MKSYIFIISIFLSVSLQATTFVGDGVGSSQKEAKKESLADLSFAIKSEVKSSFSSAADSQGRKSSKKLLKVSSNLPIIGSEFEVSKVAADYKAISTLDASKARPLYDDKLKTLYQEIDGLIKDIKAEDKSSQYRTYTQLLSLLNNYDRYRSVALVLGLKNIPTPSISVSEAKLKVQALSESFADLKQAIAFLTKGIKSKNIYIFPPKASTSNEITPFAKIVKAYMKSNISSSDSLKASNALIRSAYHVDKNGMSLSLSLINSKREVLFSNVVHLDKKAYANYRVTPKSIDFDKLLHDGYITKSKLKAFIKTDSGDDDLLFVSGDTVQLFIKINNPAYFYLVGHVDQEGKKFSYIVDLSETEGQEQFVKYVDVEDANKWTSLGEFDVEAPFGVESIQLIASSKRIKKLPQHYYDEDSGYHILGKDPRKVAIATRGLKKRMSKKAQVAESVLMYTTMEK